MGGKAMGGKRMTLAEAEKIAEYGETNE